MKAAKSTVATPTVPPSSQPTISTVISIAGAGDGDRDAAGGEAGHQAVARAGPQPAPT